MALPGVKTVILDSTHNWGMGWLSEEQIINYIKSWKPRPTSQSFWYRDSIYVYMGMENGLYILEKMTHPNKGRRRYLVDIRYFIESVISLFEDEKDHD